MPGPGSSRPAPPWALLDIFVLPPKGKLASCTFWFITSGTPSGGFDVKAAAIAVSANYRTTFEPLLGNDALVPGTRFYLNTGTGTTGVDVYVPAAGSGGAVSTPEEWAAVVQRKAAGSGRSFRGRVFVPCISIDQVDGNYLNSTGLTAFNAFSAAMQVSFVNQGLTYKPALYQHHGNTIVQTSFWTTDARLSTTRRRRPRF